MNTATHIANLYWSRVLLPVYREMEEWDRSGLFGESKTKINHFPSRNPVDVATKNIAYCYASISMGIFGGYGFDILPDDYCEEDDCYYVPEGWFERRADYLSLRAKFARLKREYRTLLLDTKRK